MNQNNQAMPTVKSGGRRFRNDVILIAALLAIVALAGLFVFLFRQPGDTVVVTIDGEHFATYSLSENVTVPIQTGKNGEQINLLIIQDGQAYVQKASCPDGICAAHRPIKREGESIVCLPHRVVITVHSASEQHEPDVVT
jgi:hypothetical protein